MKRTRKILDIGKIYNESLEIIDHIDSKYVIVKCLHCEKFKKMYIYNVEKNYSCGCKIGLNKTSEIITKEIARQIKNELDKNHFIPCTYLAKKYNISNDIVYNIKYNRSWKYV